MGSSGYDLSDLETIRDDEGREIWYVHWSRISSLQTVETFLTEIAAEEDTTKRHQSITQYGLAFALQITLLRLGLFIDSLEEPPRDPIFRNGISPHPNVHHSQEVWPVRIQEFEMYDTIGSKFLYNGFPRCDFAGAFLMYHDIELHFHIRDGARLNTLEM